jgi:hypothetical protein
MYRYLRIIFQLSLHVNYRTLCTVKIRTFYLYGGTCGEEPGNLLALSVLPGGVRVPPGYNAGDGREQVEDHHCEGVPIAAKTKKVSLK